MKTPNHIRSARNAAASAARSVVRMTEYAMEMERFALEHANDCWCDLCQCFGQGSCRGQEHWTDEEREIASMSI